MLTYLGIANARRSLLKIMVDEGKALIESLVLSSNNAIQAGLLLETVSEQKFTDLAASAARRLGRNDFPDEFRRFCDEYNLLSLDILDSTMSVRGSDRYAIGFIPEYPELVESGILEVIGTGSKYKSILVPGDSAGPMIQYFVFSEAPDSDLVVLSAEATYYDQIMRQIGIGYLIRRISEQAGIEYIFLQSREGIIFSSRSLPPQLSIESDRFLADLLEADTVGWRIYTMDDRDVLEIVRPFESVSYPRGLYRVGMSLAEFTALSRGYDRQIIIVAVALFLLTLLVVAVVSLNQNYFILDKTYRQMRSRTETIFDRLSSAVLAIDNLETVVAVNLAFREMFGIEAGAVGSSFNRIAERIPLQIPRRETIGDGIIVSEQRLTPTGGREQQILLACSSLPDDAGGGMIILIHDITEQKRLEAENRRRERLSEMGDMAAGVAHEIRNPLNAIAIAAQRLEMEFRPQAEGEEYGRLTRNILNESARLNQILTRFLELARTRASSAAPVDLHEAIQKGIAAIKDEADRGGVAIRYFDHEPVSVQGSAEGLQQVFINLIKNSLQAMPSGGEIQINVASTLDGRSVITVADSGPGFPAEALAKVFQPYFTTKADGSGLGLALAYKTISEMGGEISAANAPSSGAVIRIIIPVA